MPAFYLTSGHNSLLISRGKAKVFRPKTKKGMLSI